MQRAGIPKELVSFESRIRKPVQVIAVKCFIEGIPLERYDVYSNLS